MTDVRPILARYPQVRGNPRVTPVVGGGFSGAAVFHVETETEGFCLRRWPDQAPPIERLRELHRFLDYVHARGVTEIAVPCASRDGSTLVQWDARLWQLEPWKPGQADFVEHPTNARLWAAMHALARFHNVAVEYEPTETGKDWFFQSHGQPAPAVIERLDLIGQWTASRLHVVLTANRGLWPGRLADEFLQRYSWAAPTVARELAALARTPFRLHPCLRDIWHAHVLFQGDQVTGIVDPGAARSENVASDLSRLLGSLLADDLPGWDLALDAYSKVRALTDSERRLVRVLDRSSVVLSGLTWLEMMSRSAPVSRSAALERFQWIHARLRVLAESIDHV